jgi:hypothetical protein
MKRTFVTVAGLIFLISACNAQYKLNKPVFDTCAYTYQMGDPYNPTVMALASAIIPGLGQIFEGESARGFGFLGGFLAFTAVKWAWLYLPSDNPPGESSWRFMRYSVLAGKTILRLWSGIDASHVAKVNNLAFRARYNSNINFKVLPFPDKTDPYGLINSNPIGITIIVSF